MKKFIQSFFNPEQAELVDEEVNSQITPRSVCEESESIMATGNSNITPETPHGNSQDGDASVPSGEIIQPAISYSQIVRYPPPPIPHFSVVPVVPTAHNAPSGESLGNFGNNYTISPNFVVVERTAEATGMKYMAVVPVASAGPEGNAQVAQMDQPAPVQGTALVRFGESRNPIFTDLRNQIKQFGLNLRKDRKALRTRECNGIKLLQKILAEEDLSTDDRLALIRLYVDSTDSS